MSTDRAVAARHPAGEQPSVEYGKERSVIADTFAGRVHVEWEAGERAAMTPLGQLPFFIEYLKRIRLKRWVPLSDPTFCPTHRKSGPGFHRSRRPVRNEYRRHRARRHRSIRQRSASRP